MKVDFAITMSMSWLITTLVAIAAFFSSQLAYAYDLNPLQDICVGVKDTNASVFVNGKICKDPKLATTDDFFASGLNVSGNIVRAKFGYSVTVVDVNTMPGLNTLGISFIRADIEPRGLIPLHTHQRATELITILEGTIYAGFLLPDSPNIFKSRLFSKILNPGDVFVIPQGLIHFQYNVGNKKATVLASFNSQNPGFVMIPYSIFASDPPILDDVLAKGFQLDKKVIKQLQKKFSD
ncbi:germin-like protein subfamily 1 member 17 [Nicotiana sylvestris]|uniref:Germin-like protein n=1 Tax=Nicotiana sylvestris TaxID=4096 RepID=A0A1U7W7P0_NICSY|nr:PREDICTED: germin-like protein subfamily 1 member 17 [Nicotiana sylvestris]